MKLQNTSAFSTAKIREIIQFVKPAKVTNFDVWIKKSAKTFAGRAYYNGSSYHDSEFTPYVVVRIGKIDKFPYTVAPRGGYIGMTVYSHEELLVNILAHELRHLWQNIVKKGWRYYGSKGQFSERDADCYALHMLREWRRR